MTERLYYTDSYLREFDADVIDQSGDGTRVYLDRTAFYPTSGGQPFDRGWMNDVPVLDVVDEGERIVHLLGAPLGVGRVTGRVEWNRRFDHMQQHTGQHLLSAVIAELFGFATVSVHFGEESSTLDLETRSVTAEQLVEAEQRANAVVTENRAVHVTFEDATNAAGLRKASERSGTLRIVTIDDLDRSACGGTHVRATGEIGPILIGRAERVKQLVRVEFVCGGRAIGRARQNYDLLVKLAGLLSAAPHELPALVEAQRTEIKRLSAERREQSEELARYRATEALSGGRPRCRWTSPHRRAGTGGADRSTQRSRPGGRGLAGSGVYRRGGRSTSDIAGNRARFGNRCRSHTQGVRWKIREARVAGALGLLRAP